MLISECAACDAPVLVGTGGAIFGTWVPVECNECECTNVVEVTRMGGRTHEQSDFEAYILPELNGVERIDHPSGEATVYGDPEQISVKS